VDDLDASRPLPPLAMQSGWPAPTTPISGAEATVAMQNWKSSRRARPAAFALFRLFLRYQRNSSRARRGRFSQLRLAAQIQLNVRSGTGAARSKIGWRVGLQQARNDLSFTQRQLLANLNAFYLEADAASFQIASLRHSLDLATEGLRSPSCATAGEVSVLEVVDAQTTWWKRATPMTKAWCVTAAWPTFKHSRGV